MPGFLKVPSDSVISRVPRFCAQPAGVPPLVLRGLVISSVRPGPLVSIRCAARSVSVQVPGPQIVAAAGIEIIFVPVSDCAIVTTCGAISGATTFLPVGISHRIE